MAFTPRGIITALLTPTDKFGNLKTDAARRLVSYVMEGGVHGLFTVGTAGEYYALDRRTKIRSTEIATEEAGGEIPVYMGVTSNATRESMELAQAAKKIGADAVTILTPPSIRCSEDELFFHFSEVASATTLPVMLYSLPGSTGVALSAQLVNRLSHIKNIVGIKDSSGDLGMTEQYIRSTHEAFSVLAGRDTLILATLVYGGDGGVAATANVVPELVVSIYEYYRAGKMEEARAAQAKLAPLRHAFGMGSTSASMLKTAAGLKGLDVGEPIAPVKLLSQERRDQLKRILEDL